MSDPLTLADIERAVSAYLATGDDDARAATVGIRGGGAAGIGTSIGRRCPLIPENPL